MARSRESGEEESTYCNKQDAANQGRNQLQEESKAATLQTRPRDLCDARSGIRYHSR